MLRSILYQFTGNIRFLPTPTTDSVAALLDLDIKVDVTAAHKE